MVILLEKAGVRHAISEKATSRCAGEESRGSISICGVVQIMRMIEVYSLEAKTKI